MEIDYNIMKECMTVYKEYEWLISSYILDFYVKEQWNLLPETWKLYFRAVSFSDLAGILNYEKELTTKGVIPLSLSALRVTLKKLNLPRQNANSKSSMKATNCNFNFENMPGFQGVLGNKHMYNKFWKHVKLKKRHEIVVMSKITSNTAKATKCNYVVDIGSGLGHFSRALTYGYELKTCGIEMQNNLTEQAIKLDDEFRNALLKQNERSYLMPLHVNLKIESDIAVNRFVSIVKDAFGIKTEDFHFGIVGLHPCGDLGTTLLRLFKDCHEAKFINIVGCCYMKLSTGSRLNPSCGFPTSAYYLENNYSLSYNSLEIACHSIDNYIEKLKHENCDDLKIHSYRAVLEKLIHKHWPDLLHRQLASVKYKDGLNFKKYFKLALRDHNVNLDSYSIDSEDITADLSRWSDVVTFYSLRLLFAPLVESIILYDRILHLKDIGNSQIVPEFNPYVSPRNQILVSVKRI